MTYELTTDDVRGIYLAGSLCMGGDQAEDEEAFYLWLSETISKSWETGFDTGFAAASAEIPGYMEE